MNIKNGVSSVAKDTIVYGLSGIFSKSITLLTFPILARSYSLDEFGLIDTLLILLVVFTNIVMLGQDSAIARFLNDAKTTLDKSILISNSLIYQFTISILFVPISIFLFNQLSSKIELFSNYIELINLVVYMVPFFVIFNNAQVVLRYTFNKSKYIILTIGYSICIILMVLICTSILKVNLEELFIGYLIINMIFSVLGLFFISTWLTLPNVISLKESFVKYSIPMGIIVLIGVSLPFIERVIVAEVLDLESVGIYSAGAKIALFLSLPIGAFQTAFGPYLMKNYRDEKSILVFRILLILYGLSLSIAVLFLMIFSLELIVILAGLTYAEATIVVIPLSLGYLYQSFGLFLGVGTILSKNTLYRLGSYFTSFIIGSALMWTLGYSYGIIGVAIGASSSKFIFLIFESYFGQKLWPMRWNYSFIVILILVVSMIGYLLIILNFNVLEKTLVFIMSVIIVCLVVWVKSDRLDKRQLLKFL